MTCAVSWCVFASPAAAFPVGKVSSHTWMKNEKRVSMISYRYSGALLVASNERWAHWGSRFKLQRKARRPTFTSSQGCDGSRENSSLVKFNRNNGHQVSTLRMRRMNKASLQTFSCIRVSRFLPFDTIDLGLKLVMFWQDESSQNDKHDDNQRWDDSLFCI